MRARPSGVKTYILKFTYKGRQRWISIGRHGSRWTAELARKEAMRLLGEVVAGRDPAAKRDAEKQAATVAELAALYAKEGGAAKKPSSLRSDRGRIDNHILPLLGQRLIAEVSRADIERAMAAIEAGKTAADRKTRRHGRAW